MLKKQQQTTNHLYFCRGTKNRSIYVKFWGQEALCKGELFSFPFLAIIYVKIMEPKCVSAGHAGAVEGGSQT